MSAPRPSVLFVCVHNAGRSQMAAGFLTALGGGRVEVRSAGSAPAEASTPWPWRPWPRSESTSPTKLRRSSPPPTPSSAPTWSSPWAAATPARCFPGVDYRDWALADPPPARVLTRCAQSAIRSDRWWSTCSPRSCPPARNRACDEHITIGSVRVREQSR